jgi:hypothetical protein
MTAVAPDSNDRRALVRFGDREVELLDGSFRTSLDALPEARLVVDPNHLLEQPVDYLAPAEVLLDGDVAFSGSVVEAKLVGNRVEILCREGASLTDTSMPEMVAEGCDHTEIVYAIARAAGFAREAIHIGGTEPESEAIEVLVPILGITTERVVVVGDVQILSSDAGTEIARSFAPRPALSDEFEHGQSYARMLVPGSRLFEAERTALAAIDLSLAWLAVRSAYGSSRLPDNTLPVFERQAALGGVHRLPVVAVRGLQSDRRWIRRPPPDDPHTNMLLDAAPDLGRPSLAPDVAATDRQSLIAAHRAILAGDTTQQLQALWESVEFYVADRSVPGLFTKADRKRAMTAIEATELSDSQKARLKDVIGTVNSAPLMVRLSAAMADDGVHLTPGEVDVLRRVRTARNSAVHGRSVEPPSRDDVRLAMALVARGLVARMHRNSHSPES